jgi:hypothetical protein
VKEVMTHLEFLFTSSLETNEKVKKSKSNKIKTEKNEDENS